MKHLIQSILIIGAYFLLAACPLVRGTGNAIEAVGHGVGEAVTGTGEAIGKTGRELASDPLH